ncbi:MAG TPA: PEPxxWA-CTERM sorting domain-containing protein [Caulobacteraceae bacterium]|nr:PEPxxWA-CTERM sorting domain-containing protein [Caulobacteraceae bacterium]
MGKNVFVAVAALALMGGLAAAAPASAQIEFAVFNPVPSKMGGVVNFKEDSTGHLKSFLASTPTVFTFDLTPLANFGNLNATFDFSATQVAGSAGSTGGIVSAEYDGSFDFFYSGPTTTQGGITLTNGELLLSGTFADAAFLASSGASGAGLTDDSITGTVTYASGISATDLPLSSTGQSFTLGFIDVSPTVGLQGSVLRHFLAVGDGKFSSDLTSTGGGGGVPEPGAWALMLLGFGAIGLAARRRTRAATA